MPSADVVVVGAGLAGMSAGLLLAERGARVMVVAKGHAADHWATGPLDVAAPRGAATAADGLARLASGEGHPYRHLAGEVADAVAWLRERTAAAALPYAGDLEAPFTPLPTALGRTRPVSLVPDAQAAALDPWGPDERRVVLGFEGFQDLWPAAVAASLRRPEAWLGLPRPDRVVGVSVALPELAGRRNLHALELARLFDDASRRGAALEAMARAGEAAGSGPGRVALPAVLGLHDHAAALAAARARLPLPPFEVPLVPPSLPGLRLHAALRAALLAAGGRLQIGEPVATVALEGRRVTRLELAAAVRGYRITTEALVLATGGLAGGGLVAEPDGRLRETVLGLPVEAPPVERWLAPDPFEPQGHPLEAAGLRTDAELRPLGPGGEPTLDNVRVVGSLLAGQRYLRERCGDGVALASARRAAASLALVAGSAGVAS